MAEATKRYAVVTGANKGIGLEICKQLASHGVTVVLTARDEKRGLEAVEKLQESGLSEYIVFHELDVADPATIASLADFVKRQFGKLDILMNNAGITGTATDPDAYTAAVSKMQPGERITWSGILTQTYEMPEECLKTNNFGAKRMCETFIPLLQLSDSPRIVSGILTQTYEMAEECLKTNYFGAKRMCETFIPLLQLSDSPRIVNVSSSMGKLKNVTNEWAKAILSDAENLTEERVDEVLNKYLKDFKEGSLEAEGWPDFMSANTLSKAAMNAYTRILAKKHPSFCINCVCPGYVKTDINYNTGVLTVEEGAQGPVRLASLPNGGPSGLFFYRLEETEF